MVAQSVDHEASEQLEDPVLPVVLQDKEAAVTDSEAFLSGRPAILETELEQRVAVAVAVAGRSGAERRTAGAIPY